MKLVVLAVPLRLHSGACHVMMIVAHVSLALALGLGWCVDTYQSAFQLSLVS